ncbi:hypothetical protein ARMGADRAFT_1015181 [Armillaria gallica]|uniref:Uncharacterized protein n=1 Tax=Armillaria gallica TaxID=47427 RepID=A0A2H3D2R1_ARMGA|nr:hypothetical protein ARMGADRAFT_1015181 [Armillaria gallica]
MTSKVAPLWCLYACVLFVISVLVCSEVTTFNHQVSYRGLVVGMRSTDEDAVSGLSNS